MTLGQSIGYSIPLPWCPMDMKIIGQEVGKPAVVDRMEAWLHEDVAQGLVVGKNVDLIGPIDVFAEVLEDVDGLSKSPVDEYGRPLYGDVFGELQVEVAPEHVAEIECMLWGELEPEEEEEQGKDEDDDEDAEEEDAAAVEPEPIALVFVIQVNCDGIVTSVIRRISVMGFWSIISVVLSWGRSLVAIVDNQRRQLVWVKHGQIFQFGQSRFYCSEDFPDVFVPALVKGDGLVILEEI
ncbi:hypothetical protein BC830DRAFT_1171784 [Chytriomyces sp. MP71]|nr:hypothetical protein BC830DRAFT_1171784 [Chytriomyces sp. MP71]